MIRYGVIRTEYVRVGVFFISGHCVCVDRATALYRRSISPSKEEKAVRDDRFLAEGGSCSGCVQCRAPCRSHMPLLEEEQKVRSSALTS